MQSSPLQFLERVDPGNKFRKTRAAVLEIRVVFHGEQREMPTFLPSLSLSTDNAAMIAAAGLRRLRAGMLAPPDLNADPALAL